MIYKHKKKEKHKTIQVLKQQVSEQTAEPDSEMERAADAEHLTALNDEIDSLKESVICKHKKKEKHTKQFKT